MRHTKDCLCYICVGFDDNETSLEKINLLRSLLFSIKANFPVYFDDSSQVEIEKAEYYKEMYSPSRFKLLFDLCDFYERKFYERKKLPNNL